MRTLLVVAGLGVKVAVTPLGRPVTDRLTLPLNDPRSLIRMVVEVEAPGVRATLRGALKSKPLVPEGTT